MSVWFSAVPGGRKPDCSKRRTGAAPPSDEGGDSMDDRSIGQINGSAGEQARTLSKQLSEAASHSHHPLSLIRCWTKPATSACSNGVGWASSANM